MRCWIAGLLILMGVLGESLAQLQPKPYYVVLGAYQSRAAALRQAAKYAADGLAVNVLEPFLGEPVYRIVSQPYADRTAALSAMVTLMRQLARTDLWLLGPRVGGDFPVSPSTIDTVRIVQAAPLDTTALLAALAKRLPKAPRDTATAAAKPSPLRMEGYVDLYYATDDDAGAPVRRQYSAINYRKDEFALNTAQITANYQLERLRARITLQSGTIRESSWDGLTINPLVQEAWAGYRLAPDLWVDGGIFLTHIGGESLLPKDNWLSVQSLVTNYEPFYQSGLRLTQSFANGLVLQLHLVNGYNLIEDNNRQPSAGWQIQYNRPTWQVSYSGLVGNEQPTGQQQSIRQYHDLVLNWQASGRLSFRLMADYARQQRLRIDTLGRAVGLLGTAALVRWQAHRRVAVIGRAEFFDDKARIVLANIKGWGVTLGVEARPVETAYIRLESRLLQLQPGDTVFQQPDGSGVRVRRELVLSTGVWF